MQSAACLIVRHLWILDVRKGPGPGMISIRQSSGSPMVLATSTGRRRLSQTGICRKQVLRASESDPGESRSPARFQVCRIQQAASCSVLDNLVRNDRVSVKKSPPPLLAHDTGAREAVKPGRYLGGASELDTVGRWEAVTELKKGSPVPT